MILVATLLASTLVPVVVNDVAVAYVCMADCKGRHRVVVDPQQAKAVSDAIATGAGQSLIVSTRNGKPILIGSRDPILRDALDQAKSERQAALRAADPLGHAIGDLAWAEQMLACARADVLLHEDVPAEHVRNHKENVARLRRVVADLQAA